MAPQDTLARPLLTKADFADFLVGEPDDGRYEFEHGRIVKMPGGTANHSGIGTDFVQAIGRQLDTKRWRLFGPDRGVETPETVRYPDVIVDLRPVAPKSRWTTTPVLIVEVLSDDSIKRDKVTKAGEYLAFDTLEAYIIAEPDTPDCLVWVRDERRQFPLVPTTVTGAAAVISVPQLALSLALADIYRDVLADG